MRKRSIVVAVTLLAAGCALQGPVLMIPSQVSPDVASFRERQVLQMIEDYAESPAPQVDSLHYPLMTAAHGICDNPGAGVVFGLRYDFPRAGGPPAIISVTPGSAAHRAGLRAGDRIVGANGARFYGMREEAIRENLQVAFVGSAGSADFAVMRDTIPTSDGIQRPNPTPRGVVELAPDSREEVAVEVQPDAACAFGVGVLDAESVNAFADGQSLYVTEGMLDFVESDRELQFILAHELAHNALGHTEKTLANARKRGLIGALVGAVVDVGLTEATGESTYGIYATAGAEIGLISGIRAHSKDFEREADYLAMYMLARAGVPLDGIEDLWVRFDAKLGDAEGWSHPTHPERHAQLIAARDEILNRLAAGDAVEDLAPLRLTGSR